MKIKVKNAASAMAKEMWEKRRAKMSKEEIGEMMRGFSKLGKGKSGRPKGS